MKFICAGIDGTGSRVWRRKDGANSHVFRFVRDFAAHDRQYWHGPGNLGLEMGHIISEVTKWIFEKLVDDVRFGTPQDHVKIILVGHSRGAVAAMAVANRLNEFMPVAFLPSNIDIRCPIRVHFLGLYDAVDRSFSGADDSLSNVDAIYHAVRQNRSWNGSRWSFGSASVSRGQALEFDTAHGGVGGDPGYFDDLMAMAGDTYCNALTLVLSDAELIRRFGYVTVSDPYGQATVTTPRYTQLTGEARTRRIRELTTRWQASWDADGWIRQGAREACGAQRFRGMSAHHPYLEKDAELSIRLAQALGVPSISH